MTTGYNTITVERTESVTLIRLNRPDVLNAISVELANEVLAALGEASDDGQTKAIILTGAGDRAFSSGVDLREVADLDVEAIEPWFRTISNVYRAILLLEKPVVAALNGVAAGAGFQCALVSDLRVGCTRTGMAQPEINAGVPSIMGSYLMTPYLSWSLNQELSYTGRLLDAEECVRYGLLNDMVSPADLIERAVERATSLTEKAPIAFRLTKARFRDVILGGLDKAFNDAVSGLKASFSAGEAQLAIKRFTEHGKK